MLVPATIWIRPSLYPLLSYHNMRAVPEEDRRGPSCVSVGWVAVTADLPCVVLDVLSLCTERYDRHN